MKIVTLSKLSCATSALAVAMAAQTASAQSTDVTLGEDTGQAIIVTGSRISNPNIELSSPVAVVSESDIDLAQTSTIEETLREIPGVVPSLGSNLNNGNGGSTFIDLRGIGSNRNITLLNGTRLVPADTRGRVNLDVIPSALLERVDVLTGGAGSTYGADAISGVINFITKRNFVGVDATTLLSTTEAGDGEVFRADLTVGADVEDGRGNVVISIGYTDRKAIRQGQRAYSEFNISSISGNPGGSSTTTPIRISGAGGASGILGNISIDPDTGAEVNDGFLQLNPASGQIEPGFSPFNFNPFNYFQLPLEQYRIFTQGHYEIVPEVEVFAEASFVRNTVLTNGAPSGTFGVTAPIPLSNPFLPDALVTQLCGRDTMLFAPAILDNPDTPEDESMAAVSAPGVVEAFLDPTECAAARAATDPDDPNFTTVNLTLGRRLVEFGERLSERRSDQFQIKAGLRGELSQSLEYEAFFAYGESDRLRRQSGNGLRSRLLQSLNATSTTECIDPTNGCIPINLFGDTGTVQEEARSFIDTGNQQSVFTTLLQTGFFVSGDVGFSTPWADIPIQFVLGGEYRDYLAGTASDLVSQTPSEVLGNGAAAPDFEGGFDVSEAFAELVVPIASDRPFMEELTFEAGGRISDYSTTGTEYTWKVGATWSPIPDIQFRGNYQKVTRAPNIFELFTPQVTGLNNFSQDPCAGGAPLGNADLRAICLAQGAPSTQIGGIIVDPAGQVNTTSGGNLNLDAEDANTWTVGMVFQPDFLPRFTATIDYYNIEVTDAITVPTEDDVFGNCFGTDYAAGNFNISAASASDPACTSIRRNPATGNLFGELATTPGLPLVRTNQGTIATDGIDLTMRYSSPINGQLNWNSSFNGNWTNSSKFQASPSSINRECVGFYSTNCSSLQPDLSLTWRNTLSLDEVGPLSDVGVSLLWRWVDGFEVEPSQAGNFQPEFETISAYSYFDLSLSATVLDHVNFIVGVANILDKEPPLVGSNIGSTGFNSGNTYPSSYDVRGRSYTLTANVEF